VTAGTAVKRLGRILLWCGVLLLVGGAAGALWLLRDPEPRFRERRSELIAVDSSALGADETAEFRDYTLLAQSDLRVEIRVRRPVREAAAVGAATVRRPLYIILGGQRRGKEAGALIGDTRGLIFASLEYPFHGDEDAKGFAMVRQAPQVRQALFDTPPAVMLALDYLLSRDDVDTTRVELVGASFGAPFAVIAAALDPRVTRLWLAHGGGDPYRLINRGLEGPRLAPEKWIGRVAPRPVVMLNAQDDERIPRASVDALWEAAREPKQLHWLPGQHMQGNRPETLEQLIEKMLAIAAGRDSAGVP
jgi:dienelactone hydrolase